MKEMEKFAESLIPDVVGGGDNVQIFEHIVNRLTEKNNL